MAKKRRKNFRAGLPLLLSVWLFSSCLFSTSTPEFPFDRSVRYIVSIGGSDQPRCRVNILIQKWPSDQPMLFQAPVFYPDNPASPVKGFQAADFHPKDARGNILAARDTDLVWNETPSGHFLVFPPATASIAYEVDHDPARKSRFGLPFPKLAQGVQMIDGAYFFPLPLVGRSYAAQWRTPVDISMDFVMGAGYRLVGHDLSSRLHTNYELMFTRAVVNPIVSSDFAMANHLVTTYATTHDSLNLPAFNALLEKCVRLVEDSLLPLPSYHIFAGSDPVFWGIEGVQGYWFRPEVQSDASTHVHELIHTLVGILHGDLEDPWWKEGMTTYLGALLALQGGLYPAASFSTYMQANWDSTRIAVKNFALASPYVRNHLYSPLDSAYQDNGSPEDFYALVYGKGSQASMFLDRYIMIYSQDHYSAYHLVRDLIRRHGHAFRRKDMQDLLDEYTGRSSADFLHNLLDVPGALPVDSVKAAYRDLQAMGRFGTDTGAAVVKTAAKTGTANDPVPEWTHRKW